MALSGSETPGIRSQVARWLPDLLIAAGAGLFGVSLALGVLAFRAGDPSLALVVDVVLMAVPGFALAIAGWWLPYSSIHTRYYPRILAWVFGGIATMYAFILLRHLHPGVHAEWSLGTQAIALTIGSIGGLLIGINETTAAIRAERLESQTAKLQEREKELERQNERLDSFAKVISHDLRNPLTVARGNLELARDEVQSPYLDAVVDAHERMETMITELLALAKQNETSAELELVPLATTAKQSWETVDTGDATLTVTTDQTIQADERGLRRLFENLFHNAVEHGPGESAGEIEGDPGAAATSVEVTVGDLPDGFYVADDGVGIPPDEREKVLETGYTTATNGTGFGLSIVTDVATDHDWHVTIEESEQGGARLAFRDVETAECGDAGLATLNSEIN